MGGYLTMGYCSRTIGYCFSYCFLEIFVGGEGFDGGGQSRDGGSPSPPPLGKTLIISIKKTAYLHHAVIITKSALSDKTVFQGLLE